LRLAEEIEKKPNSLWQLIMLSALFLLIFLFCSLNDVSGQTLPINKRQSIQNSELKNRHIRGKAKNAGSGHILKPKRQGAFHTNVPETLFDIILGRPTSSSITFSILVYENMEGYIAYGINSGEYQNKTEILQLRKNEPFESVITALRPNTKYYYRFFHRKPGSSEVKEENDEYCFHTQRSNKSTFTFTVQADSHLDYNTDTEIYKRTLENALSANPDFHIALGDTFMTDKYRRNYTDSLKQYLAQRYYFGLLCHSAPLFFVIGNHDGEAGWRLDRTPDNMSVWSARTRKKYFPNPAPDHFYTGNAKEERFVGLLEDYYAWEWGDCLFIVLDPFWYTKERNDPWSRTLGKEQYEWLKRTLEKSNRNIKFIFVHHLVGGSDRHSRGGIEVARFYEWGGYNKNNEFDFKEKRPGWEKPVHQLLVDNNVSIVFHGHDHFFARQKLDGIVYQLVPQPGHRGKGASRSAKNYGYLKGDIIDGSGYIRVKVTEFSTAVDFVRTYLAADEKKGIRNGEVGFSYEIFSQNAMKNPGH